MATFKQQIELMVIPSLRKMISKEQEHLIWLEKKRNTTIPTGIAEMIGSSKNILKHLHERLLEYEEYIKPISEQNPERWKIKK